ncbi:hypothetical protein Tco_0536580 [Tanacetum coccineum]
MERLIAKAILQERGNIQAQISTQIENAIANVIPSQVDASVRSYMSGHILHVHPAQSQTSSVPEQQYQLYLAMKADPQLQQQDIAIWLALQMKFERNTVLQTACRTPAVRPRDQDDPHDDAHPEGENSAKRQKTSEYEAYVFGESSSGQVFQEEQAPSTLGNQEQDDDFDFWTDSYASDDDEIPSKQVSQEIMEEVSLTIDEAKLRKMADEMLRQRCTSGDEHQYHIDQMKNFLKSDIVWESRKEILVSPHPRKTTPLVHSCQRDPEAPALSLINQDLLYLKKGNSGPEKIVLSLHKFPAIIFNDDDIEERTSRWVNKCVKKFNPYARYGVEHWKNPHAKIFYIRKQKEPGKPKEEIYSNSKIVQVIKTYWELGHEHKFITEIVARRANDCIVSITEPDYKNLNKNDIEDIYLFGGNDESKKMQKYILKQQFEGFTVSNSDGIHKGYERFQSLLSQLEIHGAGVSTEDANQKFLRSLPSAWLYSSSFNLQIVAFCSEKHQQYNVSIKLSSLDHEDLDLVDEYDLRNRGLKNGKVAMDFMRIKKFLQEDWHFASELLEQRKIKEGCDGWNPGNKDGAELGKKEGV